MTKHILLLEPKPNEAEQLAAQIEAAGAYTVTRVQNMREACALLAAQAQDLALIPITRNVAGGNSAIRPAGRSIQYGSRAPPG